METHLNTAFGSTFTQVAWVVPDIQVSEKFFKEVLGIKNFAGLKISVLKKTRTGITASRIIMFFIFILPMQVIHSSNSYNLFQDKYIPGISH
jgi:hypothetical protein